MLTQCPMCGCRGSVDTVVARPTGAADGEFRMVFRCIVCAARAIEARQAPASHAENPEER